MNATLARLAAALCACGFAVFAVDIPANAGRPARPQAQQSPPAAVPPSNERKRTQYGDIIISGHQTMKGDLNNFASVQFLGPNTIIEVPDKKSGSRLVLHADDIKLTDPTKPEKSQVELRGHVRYTVTQTTPLGERKLTGTAGSGDYRRANQKIILSGGVRAELVDPRLDGPATLRAGIVTVDMSAEPYTYNLSGDSGTNDLRFSPKSRAPKRAAVAPDPPAPNPANQVGLVHISHWNTGAFQTGKLAKFDGSQVIADLKSKAGAQEGRITGRHVEGDFAPTGEVTRARAVDDVHYHFERPITRKPLDPKGKIEEGRQEVTGTSREALYEPEAGKITLDGGIDASLVNTLTLDGPAKLLASKLVVTEPPQGKEGATAKFEITGAPNLRRLEFTPKSPEPRPAASPVAPEAAVGEADAPAPPPAFTLGAIVLKGFEKVVLEPGKALEVISDGKQKLLLDTVDTKTHSASHLETHRFTAQLADKGGITSAETGGPLTFHIVQPGKARTPKKVAGSAPARPLPGQPQSLDGDAAKAIYTVTRAGRTISLQGPFNTMVTDPEHLASPGSVKGQKDDIFSLDLVTREFTFDTAHETIVVEFTPRPTETEPDKTPKAPAGVRKK